MREAFSHQDQGCTFLGVIKGDGARFNIGRDYEQNWIITGCRAGSEPYWGNTMSFSQDCGVGNQSSDGYVAYVH